MRNTYGYLDATKFQKGMLLFWADPNSILHSDSSCGVQKVIFLYGENDKDGLCVQFLCQSAREGGEWHKWQISTAELFGSQGEAVAHLTKRVGESLKLLQQKAAFLDGIASFIREHPLGDYYEAYTANKKLLYP